MASPIVPISEFLKQEPHLRDTQVYQMIRENLIPHVRIGRRVFIDPAKWEEFKASGGKALPGGWRREAQ